MSRPSSAASSHRPPTSSSSRPQITSTTVPFTPRPKHRPRERQEDDHALAQIAQTLASVRKVDKSRVRAELEAGTALGLESAGDGDQGEVSFHLEESTYRSRPLTSRVHSAAGSKLTGLQGRNVSSTSTVTVTSEKTHRERERERDRERDRERLKDGETLHVEEGTRRTGTTTTTLSLEMDGKRHASSSSSASVSALPRQNGTHENGNGKEPRPSSSRYAPSSRPTSRAERYLPTSSSSALDKDKDKGKQRTTPDLVPAVERRTAHTRTGSTDEEAEIPLTARSGLGSGSGSGPRGTLAMEERKLDGVPLVVQEAWVCEDLRFVLQGVQGELIRFAPDYDPEDEVQRLRGTRWKIDPSLDPSLRHLVEKILPLATFFTAVDAFVDLRNDTAYGMVNHALGSGIRGVLRDYHILTAKLESLYLTSPDFTLQSAFQYLHPTLHILSLLYALCLALDHDPFPEFDDSGGEESEEDDENENMRMMVAELGLNLEQMGVASKKQLEREAASGNIMGGEVLGVIMERAAATSGDPAAHSLYSSVLLHASQPYARTLIKWITTGTLKDPYDEFLIKEDPRINKGQLVYDYSDEYWERRYTLRDGSSLANLGKTYSDAPVQAFVPVNRPGTNRLPGGACIPPSLEPWKFKILLAGKYLNVIKECGIEIADWEQQDKLVAEQAEGTLVRMDQPKFYQRIETAYFHSNKTLLDLILRGKELIPNLKSMKHFFFLDQSEFLNQFFDNAYVELKKPASSASMTKIQSLLYMAVSNPASASSLDPHKEQLRAVMSQTQLYDWLLTVVSKRAGEGILAAMKGPTDNKADEAKEKEKEITTVEALSFDFDVQFPLSLVISRKAITRYQLIFRFLLSLRYLEFSLASMWTEHKASNWRKSTGSPDMERWKRHIFVLRAQMLQWVQHMLGFVTGDVLETRWKKLEDKLSKVSTIDQLLRDHVEYLDTCLKECTLTSNKLITVTSKLVKTITTFANHQSIFSRLLASFVADPRAESTEDKIAKRWGLISKFETHFAHHVATHLDTVTYMASSETPVLLALVARLTPLRDRDSY